MNRPLQLLLPIVLVLLALVPGWAPAHAPAGLGPLSAAAQAQMIAVLDPLSGVVQHQSLDADPQDPAAWTTLTGPVLVAEGDRIRTGRAGRAYLTFFEGAETEIGPATLVVVSTLILDDLANQNFNITLDVLLGVTLTTIDVTLDADDRFEVHTPGATAVVRGTKWWTLVHQDGSVEFEGVEGVFGVVPLPPPLPPGVVPAPPLEVTPGQRLEQLWDSWVELQPGVTGYFAPDGTPLGSLTAIRLPELPPIQPLSPTCGDGVCQPGETESCTIDCLDQMAMAACGDGLCQPEANEDLIVCPADCSPYAGAFCGNGTCESDESGITCPADCAPDQYFGTRIAELCGDGLCSLTESSLSCPADCKASAPAPDQCVVTGDAVNLRSGPGLEYPVVRWLNAGDTLVVTGISVDGAWYVGGEDQVWALAGVVTASGPCADLPVVRAPTPTPAAAPTRPPAPPAQGGSGAPPGSTNGGTGQWGGCGSCPNCGPYPAAECVQAPDGQCVWDPATCRVVGPPPEAIPAPQLVFPASVSCTTGETIEVCGSLVTPDGATIAYYSAYTVSTAINITNVVQISPTEMKVEVYCISSVPATASVTASVTDSQNRNLSDTFTVHVN